MKFSFTYKKLVNNWQGDQNGKCRYRNLEVVVRGAETQGKCRNHVFFVEKNNFFIFSKIEPDKKNCKSPSETCWKLGPATSNSNIYSLR